MRTLIDEPSLRNRVDDLGRRITEDYTARPLTIVGVLTGSVVFLADLVRRIEVPHRFGFVAASSYRGRSTSPGRLEITTDILPEVRGRDVLLLDDILDSGRTLGALVDLVREQKPLSVRTAVLLWKPVRTEVDLVPDYVGFEIPDEFVVGYGLDYADDFRHLPFIAVLDEGELAR